MSDRERALAHYVLPAEVIGDTLVVTPHGDVGGFSPGTFKAELDCLHRIQESQQVRSLIIDLGDSSYFGSEMIGGLVWLRNQVEPPGRAAICEISDDMRVGLEIMHVDKLFESFETRRAAVREIAHVGWRDRLRRPWTRVGVALGVMLLGAAALVALQPETFLPEWTARREARRTSQDYLRVVRLWEDYQGFAGPEFTEEERLQAAQQLRQRLTPIRQQLAERGDEAPSTRFLMRAIDSLSLALEGEDTQQNLEQFGTYMFTTHALLELKLDVDLQEVAGLMPVGDGDPSAPSPAPHGAQSPGAAVESPVDADASQADDTPPVDADDRIPDE